jgi:NAD(P)-dependent dehydrogenase (short-subunit alcohol dehydrogenase family)
MRTNLKEKIALVTGASSGLGAQFARVLAANGALVVLAARREERLKELRAEIESRGGEADVVPMDVTDLNSIDILVNNSGVSTVSRLTDVTPVDFDYTFNTNVRGAFFVAQAVARRMIARAQQQQDFRGRIVNIASVAAFKALSQIGVYCMTKAAVVQMTRAQALEWGRYGINVNAICPGYIRTEINQDHWDSDKGQKLLQMLPRKRIGTPSDLDSVLLMLVADESQFINGAAITADDGLSVT